MFAELNNSTEQVTEVWINECPIRNTDVILRYKTTNSSDDPSRFHYFFMDNFNKSANNQLLNIWCIKPEVFFFILPQVRSRKDLYIDL